MHPREKEGSAVQPATSSRSKQKQRSKGMQHYSALGTVDVLVHATRCCLHQGDQLQLCDWLLVHSPHCLSVRMSVHTCIRACTLVEHNVSY